MLHRAPFSAVVAVVLVALGTLVTLTNVTIEYTLFQHVQDESTQVAQAIGQVLSALGLMT